MANDGVLGRQMTLTVYYGGAPWCEFCELCRQKEGGGRQERVNYLSEGEAIEVEGESVFTRRKRVCVQIWQFLYISLNECRLDMRA